MNRIRTVSSRILGAAALVSLAVSVPLLAHHSFAGFDMTKTKVLTGVVTRVNPDANHLQIYFAPMNEERKNVLRGPDNKPQVWEVEMAGSAATAAEGISVTSFAPGTVFSVAVHPSRNGDPSGFREGPLFKCPERTPPKPGMHCDSVEGRVAFGQGKLPVDSK